MERKGCGVIKWEHALCVEVIPSQVVESCHKQRRQTRRENRQLKAACTREK